MPYVRVGKTVYKKLADGRLKKKGVSATMAKAKRYLRALYAAEKSHG